MSGKNSCRNCGSFNLEIDPCRGDTVCTDCGIVLEDSVIVSEVQFEENAHGGSSAIGQFVSSDSKGGSMTVVGSFNYGLQKESKEITVQRAKGELSRMCQQLRINQHCLDTALAFYKMALNGHLTKGRRSSLVCAACLYIACRLEKTPHLLIDFSDVLQVDPFTLGRTFTNITQALCIELPLIDPCLYVLRYANQMNLGEKTHEVSTTALRVLKRMKKDFLHCGRRPSGLCGSALIIAARFHNIRRKLKDIVNIVRIQEVTLRKRLKEFTDTPSCSLTTDEFLTVDLGEEQDPPSFKAARLKDKERLQKYTDVEYEMKMKKLQRLIDKELDKKRFKRKRNASVSSIGDDSLASCASPLESSSSILKDIIEKDLDDGNDQAVVKSTLEMIDNVCSNIETINEPQDEHPLQGIGPTLETIGISAISEQTKCRVETGNESKKPNEVATENFLNPEETSLEDLDDNDIDSYIMSEVEFKQKQKTWTDLYSSFLKEQKKKEEERLSKEKEDGKTDKKRKRQRKPNTGSAATAGEAVEKVLREKKISNKLNYDVLKSLNMDDFVKSMNFDSQLTGNGSKEVESADETKEDSGIGTCGSSQITEEVAENEDDYDEADDFEEEPETNRGLSMSSLLRGEYEEDEDYDEDYDL